MTITYPCVHPDCTASAATKRLCRGLDSDGYCHIDTYCDDHAPHGSQPLRGTAANAAVKSLETENESLRHEVNALRAKLGMGRKYVEWNKDKTTGGCPVSGG